MMDLFRFIDDDMADGDEVQIGKSQSEIHVVWCRTKDTMVTTTIGKGDNLRNALEDLSEQFLKLEMLEFIRRKK